jgi:L-ascorbate metabolism protein UlaG (beta-lactamase superfamily)
MQITKFGHSCILLDDGQTKILFDPGVFSDIPDIKPNAIIITHTHQDHLDIGKLQKLLQSNEPRIITNTEVRAELEKNDIAAAEVLEDGQSLEVGSVKISAHGNDHAIIHPDLPKSQNTGYLINESIYHPGDALHVPSKPVEILLLPLVAPWSKISETFDYITSVKARVNFPIHDAFLVDNNVFLMMAKSWCEKNGLEFIEPELNKPYGF